MFGPLSDLRASLLQGLQLNSDLAGAQKCEQVPAKKAKGIQIAPQSNNRLVTDANPSVASSSANDCVLATDSSLSCKKTCPHYHGNAPGAKSRGKATVTTTIHDILRQHVPCKNPDCPGSDTYCKTCCPNFACTHRNEEGRSNKDTGCDAKDASSRLVHDQQLCKGKGIESDRNPRLQEEAGGGGNGQEAEEEMYLDVSLRRVVKLAIAFFFIYSAMNSLSEYVTSVLPNTLGDESLFIIQTMLCASSLAAPSIVIWVGELRAMVLGGLTHVIYLVVLMFPSRILVLLSSALCGFGASLVWVAQGAFLTKSSPNNQRGLFAGVFWGIYYFADIVGNLVAYFVFRFSSQNALFGLGATSALVGVLLLFMMEDHGYDGVTAARSSLRERLVQHQSTSTNPARQSSSEASLLQMNIATFDRWFSVIIFALLTPMTLYMGFESAFWTGEFTKLLPTTTIGLVLLCTGVGQVMGAFLLSWLSDHFPCSSPTFLTGAAASVGGLLICIPMKNAAERQVPFPGPHLLGVPVIAYLAGFLFGVADGVITSHMFAIIGRLFPSGRKPKIWAVFNLLGNGGAAITYWLGIIYPLSRPGGFLKQILSQIVVLCLGTPLYMLVDVGAACFAPTQRRPRNRALTLS